MEKILVIEDDNRIREAIKEILEFEGYECKSSCNGREGILTSKEFNPSLIICDVMMPEMNGYEVLNELKKESSTDSIPFIFLTAMIESKDMRKGMNLGADDYINKPFTNDDLLTTIKVRLKKSSDLKNKLDELRNCIAQSLPHELRTPLVSIIGYAGLLNDKHKNITPDMIYEYSGAIYKASIRLSRCVENYILYSRIEIYNKQEISVLPELNSISTDHIKKMVNKVLRNYDRDEDLELEINDAFVRCSNAYYLKIIEELLDNAFKFSTKGDSVLVKTYDSSNEHIITISDKGKGMLPEQIVKAGAYEQFERKICEQQGSGLGLSLSIILTKMSGGTLSIESEYGSGTVVCVRIPSGK
jgi:CheY-like chemotaxis protein